MRRRTRSHPPAATILLLRDDPEFEVLMVKRHHQIDFASGALVFPGGKTHAGDHDPRLERRTPGLGRAPCPSSGRCASPPSARSTRRPASCWPATRTASPFRGDERAAAARDDDRQGRRPFIDLVRELDVYLDLDGADGLRPLDHAADLTPKRFDTWFYVAIAPTPTSWRICDGWETVDAEWIAPSEALRLADAGERTVIFPTRMNLQLLAEASSADDAVARAKARQLVTVVPKIDGAASGACW